VIIVTNFISILFPLDLGTMGDMCMGRREDEGEAREEGRITF
jgi:hypothetical protein